MIAIGSPMAFLFIQFKVHYTIPIPTNRNKNPTIYLNIVGFTYFKLHQKTNLLASNFF